MLKKIHLTTTILLSGIVVVLCVLLQRSCSKNEEAENFQDMYNASMDTLHKTRNELGQEKTTTSLLLGTVGNLQALNSSKDSTLRKLQKLVDKKTISATVLTTSTGNTVSSATTSTQSRDTIRSTKDSLIYIYPQYNTEFKNRWENFNITANKDTFLVKYKVYNEYEFKQEFMKQGKGLKKVFSASVPMVSVTNLNPNTETLELKSFAVKPKKHSRLKTFLIGGVAGAVATYIIIKG
jgi:hypothetical protein